MRLCFFNRSYWPDVAATGQLLTELAEDLVASHGCEVSVVAGRPLAGSSGAGGRMPWWRLVRGETHNGVRILRANGTCVRPRRFAGRALNYVTYLLSAAVASFGAAEVEVYDQAWNNVPAADLAIAIMSSWGDW